MDIVERLRNAETSVLRPDGSVDLVNHVAADEIERLREAIRFAVEAIDGDDVIGAWERLSAALGEGK